MQSPIALVGRKLSLLAVIAVAVFGSLGLTSSASAADAPACAPAVGGPVVLMRDFLFDASFTPKPWNSHMQGETATVTVTGKTQRQLKLALLSYKTQSAYIGTAFPQQLYQRDMATVNGCETVKMQVKIPECYYQVDFLNAESLTEDQIQKAIYGEPVLAAELGGDSLCDFGGPPTTTTTTTTTPTTTTPTPTTPITPTVPILPPVNPTPNPKPNPPVGPGGNKVACSSVTAKGVRVRAKQKNTITVRVKTSIKSTKVTLKGAGLKSTKKINSKGVAVFRVQPKKAGRIRVTATGCAKVAAVKVLSAKRGVSNAAPKNVG